VKLVHLVGFIKQKFVTMQSYECKIPDYLSSCCDIGYFRTLCPDSVVTNFDFIGYLNTKMNVIYGTYEIKNCINKLHKYLQNTKTVFIRDNILCHSSVTVPSN